MWTGLSFIICNFTLFDCNNFCKCLILRCWQIFLTALTYSVLPNKIRQQNVCYLRYFRNSCNMCSITIVTQFRACFLNVLHSLPSYIKTPWLRFGNFLWPLKIKFYWIHGLLFLIHAFYVVNKKSCIRVTLNLLTCLDSCINTIKKSYD